MKQYIQMTEHADEMLMEHMTDVNKAKDFVDMNNIMLKSNYEFGMKQGFVEGVVYTLIATGVTVVAYKVCKYIKNKKENNN